MNQLKINTTYLRRLQLISGIQIGLTKCVKNRESSRVFYIYFSFYFYFLKKPSEGTLKAISQWKYNDNNEQQLK